jgi:hypothetical protein
MLQFNYRKTPGAVAALIREQGASFEPEAIAAMTAAYHAILEELRLSDREDAATLMVAKRVIEVAALGERDPQRLVDATLELLCR